MLELPAIVERFATDFDDLPEIVEGVRAGRMLITSGVLVSAVAVFGLATSDATIDLTGSVRQTASALNSPHDVGESRVGEPDARAPNAEPAGIRYLRPVIASPSVIDRRQSDATEHPATPFLRRSDSARLKGTADRARFMGRRGKRVLASASIVQRRFGDVSSGSGCRARRTMLRSRRPEV